MARLRFVRADGSFARQLDLARSEQPTYLGGWQPAPGFHSLSRTTELAPGSFPQAGEAILSWQLHRRIGLRVHAEMPRVTPGGTVVFGLGLAGCYLVIPCRVDEVYDEPDGLGFSYRTLPGHPECGLERFVVELGPDGSVRATVSAVSRPGTALVRLGGPVSRLVQRRMTARYLAAL